MRWKSSAIEEMVKCGAEMHDEISACKCRWCHLGRCDQAHISTVDSWQLQHLKTNLILWALFKQIMRRTHAEGDRKTDGIPHGKCAPRTPR